MTSAYSGARNTATNKCPQENCSNTLTWTQRTSSRDGYEWRYIKGQWLFSSICHETKACFLQQSDRHTLTHHTHPDIAWNTRDECHVKGLRLPKRQGLHSSHSQPQPKLRRPGHRCTHPAQWKYMVGSHMKYASYTNIQRSLRKLSTGMVVASALWRWSFCPNIIKHIPDLYA